MFLQPAKTRSLMISSRFLNSRLVMPSQQVKACRPILSTCSGIMDMPTLLQSQNAHSPISLKLSGKSYNSRLWSMLKALFPMYLTVSGIFTDCKFSHVLKARFSMVTKPSGRITLFMNSFISNAFSLIIFTVISLGSLLKSTIESFPSHFTRRLPYCESSIT